MILQFINKYSIFKNKKSILIHLAAWSLLLLLPYPLSTYSKVKVSYNFHMLFVFFHLIIFYTNYFFLIPSLLFRRKAVQYLFLSVILFLSTFYIKEFVIEHYFGMQMVDPVKFMIPGKLAFSDAAVALLPQINVANNIQVVFTINTFMFFYIISLALRFFQKWQRDENDKAKLEKEKISTELSFLKHQINPHFIFNSLNSIYSLSMSNSKSASESILKLSSILRYMLYQSDKNVCNSTEELTIIDDYIQLQKLRLSDKVSVEYKFIKDSVEYKIEPLIIITLLENAFKYGVDTNSNSFIQILITIINGKLTLKVKNKIVRQIKGGEQHSGIGLKNLQRRLDLVYPNRYSYNYNVDFKNMIYSVFLEINL